ncbi:MAG: hypothetical protein KA743_03885 [Geothrix sp.]|nr:hypothetical protein [Geothrix sp.]
MGPPWDPRGYRPSARDFTHACRHLTSNGNRAAAAICPWLVLDKGMPVEEALRIAKLAGLQLPETEAAVRGYIASKGRA